MEASSVTELLFSNLGYRAERQKVISSNIANMNTPNYKTKELEQGDSFEKTLLKQRDIPLYTTNKSHINMVEDIELDKHTLYEVKGLVQQNDGNNVDLDKQMSEMTKNSVMFSAIQSSIKKDSTWFKAVIDASSKN